VVLRPQGTRFDGRMTTPDWLKPEWWKDELIKNRGWERKKARLFEHYMALMIEQISAVAPISFLLIGVMYAFFGVSVTSPIMIVFGLTMAVCGLSFIITCYYCFFWLNYCYCYHLCVIFCS
jgi:hypothetical protein